MSEMEYEEAPQVYVPLARTEWVGTAFEAWTRGCFPPRRGFFVVWGIMLPIWALWVFMKLFIYMGGVLLIIAAALLWMMIDPITYRRRRKRAILAEWGPYMKDLHGEA